MHARDALQGVVATQHRQRGREGAHGRAGVAHEQCQRVLVRRATTQALHGDARALYVNAAAQLSQGLQHHPRVVRIEQVVDMGRARTQGGQQQHPVYTYPVYVAHLPA